MHPCLSSPVRTHRSAAFPAPRRLTVWTLTCLLLLVAFGAAAGAAAAIVGTATSDRAAMAVVANLVTLICKLPQIRLNSELANASGIKRPPRQEKNG